MASKQLFLVVGGVMISQTFGLQSIVSNSSERAAHVKAHAQAAPGTHAKAKIHSQANVSVGHSSKFIKGRRGPHWKRRHEVRRGSVDRAACCGKRNTTLLDVSHASADNFSSFFKDGGFFWETINRLHTTGRFTVPMKEDPLPLGTASTANAGGSMNDWLILSAVLAAALCLEVGFLQKVHFTALGHAMVIIGWFLVACVYSVVVFELNGKKACLLWWDGYLLDWMLNFDNLFVFHIVLKVFRTPAKLRPKALGFWIFGAVGFRLAFYVVVAQAFNMVVWFQFICAFFLIYSAVETLRDEDEQVEVEDMGVTKFLNWCLGGRLDKSYDEDNYSLCSLGKDKKLRANLLALVILILWFADIVFAVDSVSAKVLQVHNKYLSLSSTVFCMFGMRSLLFMLEEMVDAFDLLKYGVSAILMLIGVDLLISPWYDVSAVASCTCIVVIVVISLLGSVIASCMKPIEDEKKEVYGAEAACDAT